MKPSHVLALIAGGFALVILTLINPVAMIGLMVMAAFYTSLYLWGVIDQHLRKKREQQQEFDRAYAEARTDEEVATALDAALGEEPKGVTTP